MDLTDMIETGAANPFLLFVMALLLGGLHGLEPGHSKTMIAAYIIAIRGTVAQAVLLGVSAAISHSVIVWVLAIAALTYGNELIGEEMEPWFMILSGLLVIGIACWMYFQMRRSAPRAPADSHGHTYADDHEHGHDHGVHTHHSHDHLDAHAMAHAHEIEARLGAGKTSTWQTILFGLSGGLIPCPAAITVFLLCLQLGKMTLGIILVSAFSVGLAVTLVLVGAVAALGLKQISRRTSRLDRLFSAAPYVSAALIAVIGCLMLYSGWHHLGHVHA
ncbi:MAG: nickel/cobalt efflux transporter RcnA [Oricola sp.]|nr:nickel/cobalt efflux transporter RcnA [Oricola sp.]